jgi:hypothetical protein
MDRSIEADKEGKYKRRMQEGLHRQAGDLSPAFRRHKHGPSQAAEKLNLPVLCNRARLQPCRKANSMNWALALRGDFRG